LLADISDSSFPSLLAALQRLCFYYPEAGEPLAVKVLSRPCTSTESTHERTQLAKALADIPSAKLDKEFAELFCSLNDNDYRSLADADLSLVCMDRLIGKGLDREFESYCHKRLKELERWQQRIKELVPWQPQTREEEETRRLLDALERIRKGRAKTD